MNQNIREPDRRRTSLDGDRGNGLRDLRPSSPGQLALIGVGLWLAGFFVPALGFLSLLGVVALVVAGLSMLVRPRTREKYWRGQRIDLDGEPSVGERLYRLIYRR